MNRPGLTATALLVVGVVALLVAGTGLAGLLGSALAPGLSDPRAALFGIPAWAVMAVATSVGAVVGVACIAGYVRAARI